ncbi:MAG: hypothetical protein ACJATF_003074, partial [Flavobacteriales bacterium]
LMRSNVTMAFCAKRQKGRQQQSIQNDFRNGDMTFMFTLGR